MKNIFEIDNFNLIQDNENYYFFRALNKSDNKDLDEGIILDDNGKIIRIRTDRERYAENPENGTPKYTKEDDISLEQVYDHIKMHYRKDTNCISLSTDANAIIDYGRGSYNDKYIMVKVPKKEIGQNVKFAGKYLLEEIEKEVNKHIDILNPNEKLDAEIISKLQQIENAKSIVEIIEIIKTTYKGQIDISKSGMKQGIQYKKPQARLSRYQALSDEQNLEKNKLVGKLTLLENKKGLNRIIPLARNSKLLETVGNAFSSMELVHYGDIPGDKVSEVPSKIMDMFALIQQIKDDNIPNIDEIKNELVKYINNGMKFRMPEDSIFSREDKVKDNITIEEMYNLTNGRVEYGNANSIIKNVFYLAKSQARARELANILNQITGNNPQYAQIIQYIAENGFEIEPDAITRQTGKGYKISESVNLDLKKNEENLIEDIKHLSTQELIDIMEKGGLADTKNIITNTFSNIERDEQISKQEYYASAIIDLYDWKKIGIEEFTVEQRNDLLQKLQEKDSINIYRKLQEAGISEKEIPRYVFNIASKEHLSNILEQENFVELLKQNEEELKQELSIPQIETFLGYYAVDGTQIVLRDYQRNAVLKTDEIFNDRRFASVVLPTGAGKSFVALTELMKHKDEKMLYLAPQNEILEQTKDYIIEFMHGKQGTIGKSKDEIIAEVFPNIKFETYSGLLAQRGKQVIKQNYDFIVLDELHRTGAKEWETKLNELLNSQEESVKVLGITATPTRDMDDRNMAKEMALKLGYTKEEIEQKQHIAMDMDLVEAIKLGLVVNPKIISCEYSLNQDGSMEDLLAKIDKIEDPEIKKELLNKYEKLRRNLDKAQGMPEIL